MTLLLCAITYAPVSAQRAPDPERAAVQQVITNLAQHIQSANWSAIDTLFPARGVHILSDSATTHGWPEYRDQHLKPELARYEGLQYSHTSVEAVVRGAVAWVAFRRVLAGSNSAVVQGRGTAVLEKIDNRWIIVHLHMSH